MGRPKGSKSTYKFYKVDEKFKIIEPIINNEISITERSKNLKMNSGLLTKWVHQYYNGGIEALGNKRKPGNHLAKYSARKELNDIEKLEYENLLLKIEVERLKKGYTSKEADLSKQRRLNKKSLK